MTVNVLAAGGEHAGRWVLPEHLQFYGRGEYRPCMFWAGRIGDGAPYSPVRFFPTPTTKSPA